MKRTLLFSLAILCAIASRAAIHTETIEYKQGDTTLEGFVAYDDATKTPMPGVLIVHQWKGLTAYEKRRAEMLAGLGYAVDRQSPPALVHSRPFTTGSSRLARRNNSASLVCCKWVIRCSIASRPCPAA